MTNEEFVDEYFKNETFDLEKYKLEQLKLKEDKDSEGGNEDQDEIKTRKEREYKEIMKSPFKYNKGWLLLDYPLNYK